MKIHINLLIIFIVVLQTSLYCITTKSQTSSISQIDVCKLLENVPKNISFIMSNSHQITIEQQENCILDLVDSLTQYYIKTENSKYLIALDSLCSNSDGDLAEYFDEIFIKIFYNNFKSFMLYLYLNPDSKIEEFLVWGLSLEVNMAEDKLLKQKEIWDFANTQVIEQNLNNDVRQCIKSIISQIDPNIGD
jgi:hypothetical protein